VRPGGGVCGPPPGLCGMRGVAAAQGGPAHAPAADPVRTVEVEAPRFKMCRCRPSATQELARTVSPVCALLTARCTPELERVQAELGARTSFRDGARILETLLPASPANQEGVRNRTHAVALRREAAGRQAAAEVTAVRNEPDEAAAADEHRPIVMLDGAYIRAVPGHQVRNFEAICGKVEHEGHPTPPDASLWCAAWPSSRMPCCARRCSTRVDGRATW